MCVVDVCLNESIERPIIDRGIAYASWDAECASTARHGGARGDHGSGTHQGVRTYLNSLQYHRS